MKIGEIKVEGFGCLRGTFSFKDGLNFIVGPNEAGKSTMLKVMVSLLYGLERDRRKNPTPEDEKFKPWKGGPYAAHLDVALARGKRVRISKDFSAPRTKVRDLSTNLEIQDDPQRGFKYDKRLKDYLIGENLLGISKEAFLRSAVVGQAAILLEADRGSLLKDIESTVDSFGSATSAEALGRLQNALAKYEGTLQKKGKIQGEIELLREKVRELDETLMILDEKRRAIGDDLSFLEELKRKEEALAVQREKNRLLAKGAQVKRLEKKMKLLKELEAEKEALEEEALGLEAYRAFPLSQVTAFEKCHASYETLARELEGEREHLNNVLEEKEKRERELLERFPKVKDLTRAEKDSSVVARGEIKNLWKEKGELEKKAQGEKAQLDALGIDIASFCRMREKLSSLSPQEASFLTSYEDSLREKESQGQNLTNEAEMARLKGEHIQARRKEKKKTGLALLTLGSGIFLLALLMRLWGQWPQGTPWLFLGSLPLLCLGLLFLWRARAFQASELTHFQKKIDDLLSSKNQLGEKRKELDKSLSEISKKVGFSEDISAFLNLYKQYQAQKDPCLAFINLQRKLEEIEEKEAQKTQWLLSFFEKAGLPLSRKCIEEEDLRQMDSFLEEWEKGEKALQQVKTAITSLQEKVLNREKRVKEEQESFLVLLRQAGLSHLPEMEAIEKFREGVTRAKRYHDIKKKVKEDLEQQRKTLLEGKEKNDLEKQVKELYEEIERGKNQGLFPDQMPEKDDTFYLKEAEGLEREKESVRKAYLIKKEEVNDIVKEIDKTSELRAEKEKHQNQLQKTQRYFEALELARETLEEVTRESHIKWKERLSPLAEQILNQFSHDKYLDLKFTEDLSFTIVSREKGEPLREEEARVYLSQGAKDLLYLIVRLAMAQYFSRSGEALPIIFDDSFDTLDDERFCTLMDFLMDLSSSFQIFYFTCHKYQLQRWIEEKGLSPGFLIDLEEASVKP